MLAVCRQTVVSARSTRGNAITVDAPYRFHNVRFGYECRNHLWGNYILNYTSYLRWGRLKPYAVNVGT